MKQVYRHGGRQMREGKSQIVRLWRNCIHERVV